MARAPILLDTYLLCLISYLSGIIYRYYWSPVDSPVLRFLSHLFKIFTYGATGDSQREPWTISDMFMYLRGFTSTRVWLKSVSPKHTLTKKKKKNHQIRLLIPLFITKLCMKGWRNAERERGGGGKFIHGVSEVRLV